MTRIQELVIKARLELDGENIRAYDIKFAKANGSEIKSKKQEIVAYLKEQKAKREKQVQEIKEAAEHSFTFTIYGWESVEVTIDTREKLEKEFNRIASITEYSVEEVRKAYNKTMGKEEEVVQEESQKQITEAKAIIAKAETQEKVMTEKEFAIWAKNYNEVVNEGEKDGYIPRMVTQEKLEWAKRILAQQ